MAPKKDNYYQHSEIIIDKMIELSQLSQNQFAEQILGIKGPSVTGARKSGKIPDGWFDIIKERFGVTKEELCELPKKDIPDYAISKISPENLPGFSLVPLYKAKLSGGYGSFETSDQIESTLAFRTEFLHSRGIPDKMAMFTVSGESMEPFIYGGDVVLVDLQQNEIGQIVDGKAYAFREDHTVKVKRLSLQGRVLIASSENSKMFPPYEVDMDRFQLIGRVIWIGHEVW